MARYGFSGDELDMKKLILFVMTLLPESIDEDSLRDIALLDDNANHFVFIEALEELLEGAQLTRTAQSALRLTDQGAKVASIVKSDVPAALRHAAEDAAALLNERLARNDRIYTDAVRIGGDSYFEAALSDGQSELVFIRLLAGNDEKARLLCRRFRKNAEAIYEAVWKIILEDA